MPVEVLIGYSMRRYARRCGVASRVWGLGEGWMKATACCGVIVSEKVECDRDETY